MVDKVKDGMLLVILLGLRPLHSQVQLLCRKLKVTQRVKMVLHQSSTQQAR